MVSYDIDGAREVCLDGVTGYLVPARNVEHLADRIIHLCRHPEERSTLAAAGQRLCETRFPHEFMTQKIRQLYTEVLKNQDVSTRPSEN